VNLTMRPYQTEGDYWRIRAFLRRVMLLNGVREQSWHVARLDYAPGDEISAFVTAWYDDVTRAAYLEPVGTVPEHQRRGLARAAITEGLRRLQRLGATRAFVGGYEPGANALYASVLSPQHDRSEQWITER
jgi:GNAT superfamily N-acetyltransferase